MRRPPRFFARLSFSAAVSLASAVTLLTVALVMGLYEDSLYRAQKVREVRVQAEILAASVTAALAFDDSRAAQEYVDALKLNDEVDSVAVYGLSGTVFASFARDGVVPMDAAPVQEPVFKDNRLAVAVPVFQEGTPLGTVYLQVVTETFQRRLMRYGGMMLLIVMASLVLLGVGTAQARLRRANLQLEEQRAKLEEANRKLQAEMEERARAEDALRQSQKMEAIGQLSGGIAHDFNNLLTVGMGNLQLMQRRLAQGESDVQRYITAAMEGLQRAANLTKRILAFSRRQPLSPRPVNLSKLVENMDDLLRHSVGERIQIESGLKANWWTLCDANQMENVVLNLAINARDAMPNGGRLEIGTEDINVAIGSPGFDGIVPGDYVRLTVRDTGVGMSERVKERAIDPFFTTKPQGQGTGLGLSMTFGFVRQSNGYLSIDSALGEGTTITILMPRHDATANSMSA